MTAHSYTTRGSVLVVATVCLLLFASMARAQSVPGYQPPAKATPANELSITQKAARGQAPLAKLYGHLKADAAKVRRLPALDQRATKSTKMDKRLQVGVVRPLSVEINPLTDSALYPVGEGDVRISQIVSTGASATRVHFKGMSLPAGARVFVYSANNPDEYFGPYVNRGPYDDGIFWTPPVPGDTVIIEYFTPAGTNTSYVPFTISEVAHIYKDEITPQAAAGSCNLEVTPAWSQIAKSVGLIQFVSGGVIYDCTGTLLNDSGSTTTPYFLTANHCISTQTEAQTATVYWNYLSGDFPNGQTTNGANLLVTGTASDFSLLQLTGSVPTANLFFSGWDASFVSPSTSIAGIHHPSASHKRISFGSTNGDGVAGLPGPTQNFTGVAWNPNKGVTESGSSGSGIWLGTEGSPTPNLVGTLYGGFSDCSNPTGIDYYGRFSVTYPNLAGFLSGSGSCVTSISPGSQVMASSGGSGSFTVNAPGGCNWTASSADAFVTITGGNSGNGSGTVNFSIAANPNGVPRTGSIVVGSQIFKVNQQRNSDGGCAPKGSISLNGTVNGSLQAGCLTRDGSYVDAYTFSANAGQQVSVSMSSAQFDTYLYLLNTDGTLLALNDDNGGTNSRIPPGTAMVTLPTTGTYTILPSAFCDAGDSQCGPWSGAYTLTLSIPRTLTVASSNPNSGVVIAVNPTDTNGQSGNGTTQFTRTYAQGVNATLVAPSTAPNGNIFQKWQKDGADWSSTTLTNVPMDTDHTLTAIYRVPINYDLTVASSNPNSGVTISVSPNCNSGSNVTTPFTGSYVESTTVCLTAPTTAPGGNVFQKWQKDGVDFTTGAFISVFMNSAHTVTAVYIPPAAPTMTVNSTNPSSGVNITVSPADNNSQTDGTTSFTRTYFQTTQVTLTAPATAPNGNIFFSWMLNGSNFSFSRTTTVTVGTLPFTMTAVYSITPVVFIEANTNNAAAVNSVTLLRGPFQILDPHNFSVDGHTRIILFVANVPGSDPSLGVAVPNFQLPIEAVGPLTNLPGMSGTSGVYIVCKLPDGLPTGPLQLTVLYKGVSSQPVTLNIAP